MIDPRWKTLASQAELAQRDYAEASGVPQAHVITPPPEGLSGDQVSLHRLLERGLSSQGSWTLWTERGPLTLSRETWAVEGAGSGWVALPMRQIVGLAPDDLQAEMREWFYLAGLDHIGAPTRRELITIIQAALLRSPRGG